MPTVSGTFSGSGVSNVLRLRGAPETVTISVASGFTGSVVLERSVTAGESAWETVKGPFTGTLGFSGTYRAEPLERLRLRAKDFSGSSAYSIADGDAILHQRRNPNNEVVMELLESGDRIYRDLWVEGTLYVGGLPVTATAATESAAGILELATDAEAQAGTDTTRAITPANLQAVTGTETRKGVLELATDAEAQTGTDTTRAITPANLQAVTGTETRKGVLELATDAEAQAGVDTARAITPANLQAVTGTETRKGVLELATNAEAVTGTDTERAVTPAGVAAAIAASSGGPSGVFTLDATTPITGVAGDQKIVDCSAAAKTYTMPTSGIVGGVEVQLRKVGSYTLTVDFGSNKLLLPDGTYTSGTHTVEEVFTGTLRFMYVGTIASGTTLVWSFG